MVQPISSSEGQNQQSDVVLISLIKPIGPDLAPQLQTVLIAKQGVPATKLQRQAVEGFRDYLGWIDGVNIEVIHELAVQVKGHFDLMVEQLGLDQVQMLQRWTKGHLKKALDSSDIYSMTILIETADKLGFKKNQFDENPDFRH